MKHKLYYRKEKNKLSLIPEEDIEDIKSTTSKQEPLQIIFFAPEKGQNLDGLSYREVFNIVQKNRQKPSRKWFSKYKENQIIEQTITNESRKCSDGTAEYYNYNAFRSFLII